MDELKKANNEVLLRTFAALTHRMHSLSHSQDLEAWGRVRDQRDLVEEEIIHRMELGTD